MLDFCNAWLQSVIVAFGEDLNVKSVYRDVRRDVTGLRIYLCGWQEIKNFDCLSMKAEL